MNWPGFVKESEYYRGRSNDLNAVENLRNRIIFLEQKTDKQQATIDYLKDEISKLLRGKR